MPEKSGVVKAQFSLIDNDENVIRCATQWKDLPAFEDLLVQRLTGKAELRDANSP